MKTLFFECGMGAAGDMIMAALLELHDRPEEFIDKLNSIGIPDIAVTAEKSVKCGVSGTYIRVLINGREENPNMHKSKHEHSNCGRIEQLIGSLNISSAVKENTLGIYRILAEAESSVHGVPIEQIHFHEIGEMDAVTDIIGVCMLIEELEPALILASPIHTGSGQVSCAHGVLPVPAPATAEILKNIPIYGGEVRGELCTPTGAAILKYFVKDFVAMPIMKVSKIGYGMGKKDFKSANCIRAFFGEKTEKNDEEIIELLCNLDDMTPEAVAFAAELLLEEGALDVYTVPIGMKKGRAGVMLACICEYNLRKKMLQLIFKHTTTLGIRENISRRYILERESSEVQTPHGTVRVKSASGYGVVKSKPE
ncbi:MAG: nickel pincer cofactor biosynthesis protein LarC, partial [Oscillospiraceae bacterium]|nr:nickel pincer cofactor biosynthesis protein LarC [Oscillospiraceae bacterium]